jgi:hypothetical protein
MGEMRARGGGGRSDARSKRMGCPAARARGGVVEEGV